jgi:hypothetical protein
MSSDTANITYICEAHILPAIRISIPKAINGIVHVARAPLQYSTGSCAYCSAPIIYQAFYNEDRAKVIRNATRVETQNYDASTPGVVQ